MLHRGSEFVHPRRREGEARPQTGMGLVGPQTVLDFDSPTGCVADVGCMYADSLRSPPGLLSASYTAKKCPALCGRCKSGARAKVSLAYSVPSGCMSWLLQRKSFIDRGMRL
jgi:hypothetical protein